MFYAEEEGTGGGQERVLRLQLLFFILLSS